MDAWWEGELLDRCVLLVTTPRQRPLDNIRPPQPPADAASRWLDVEYQVAKAEVEFAFTFFGGEAFPIFFPNLGSGIAATYLGVEPVFANDTVWFDQGPTLHRWEDRSSMALDEDNPWWRLTKELTEASLVKGENRWVTSITDLGGNLDLVASLRGTEALLLDLIDHPAEVKQLSREVDRVWQQCFTELDAMVRQYMPVTSSWDEKLVPAEMVPAAV